MNLLESCLGLAKRLLPALLALALMAVPLAGHPVQHALSAGPIATAALSDADHDQGEGCAQETAGLHCTASACAQAADASDQPCPVMPLAGGPAFARTPPLASLSFSPALQPPILALSA
jgi:hypothetical protein